MLTLRSVTNNQLIGDKLEDDGKIKLYNQKVALK